MTLVILQYDGKTRMVKAVMRPSEKRLALLMKEGVAPADFAKSEKMAAGADSLLVVEDEEALGLKDVPFHRWQVAGDGHIVVAPKPADLAAQRGEIENALNAILAGAFKAKRPLDATEQAKADELQAKLDLIDAMVSPP